MSDGPRWLEYVAVDDLRPHPKNPKGHDLALLRKSIGRWGYTAPVLVCERTGYLAAGHGRREGLLAERAEGAAPPEGVVVGDDGRWTVPVVRGWSSTDDGELEGYVVADNATTVAGGWIDGLLAESLAVVRDTRLGFDGVGFAAPDLDELVASLRPLPSAKPDADPDELPPDRPGSISARGDLWVLGDHRVLCGDATDKGDVDRVLAGEPLTGVVVTDPPYGVAIGAKNRALDAIDRAGRVLTDLEGDRDIGEVRALWSGAFKALADTMAPGCPYYMFGPQGGDLGGLLLATLKEAGLPPRHTLIWVKNRASFSIGRLDYDYQHEPIIYGWMPGGPHPWYATTSQSSALFVDRPSRSPDHPTMKPVDLLGRLIVNSTRRGGIVLDPFGGSGSTLIAAHGASRRARLLEIEPHYVDVICRRWQTVTGVLPCRESGETEDFLAEH